MNLSFFRALVCICIFSLTFNAQSITLSDAIENVLKFDPTLQASKLNLLAAEENIAIARSRLLPQVSLQGSSSQITQTTTQELVGSGNAYRSFTGPSVNHQFVVRQALFRPRDLSALTFAELQTSYVDAKFKLDAAELKSKVVNAWIDVLGAKQISDAYEKPLSLIKDASEQEKAKYEKGDGTKDAVSEAEAQFQNALAILRQAQLALKVKQSTFEKLTGVSAEVLAEKKLKITPKKSFEEYEKDEAWKRLKEESLELKLFQIQEQIQLQRVNMVETEHKPTLDLIASMNLAKNDATTTQGYQYKNQQIGVQYTFPLFSGGGISSALRQANYSYQASLLDTEGVLNKLQNEFENNWSQLQINNIKINANFKLYMSAIDQEYATTKAYELGVKSKADSASTAILLSKRLVDLISVAQDYYKFLYKIKNNQSVNFENLLEK